jgi:hypothetical protein
MFVPLEPAAWPAPGEVRDLRVSLNAPVILGGAAGAEPTRAALGWLPGPGPASVVRLWLRPERDPAAVRAFEVPERPLGPAARATALERAETFLAGLGFLFDAAGAEAQEPWTSDPDPAPEPAARPAADYAAAVRADVLLTRFRRGAWTQVAARRPSPPRGPRTGGIER